jgi:hypothetical protein
VRAPTTFLCALPILCTPCVPILCVRTPNPHHAVLNLVHTSAHCYFLRITTLHHATLNLSVHTHAPIFSVHYQSTPCSAKFKCAHPHANIFHASQAFHRASCIFSAHTYAHSFLCASIPREFCCINWAFCQTFSQFSP